jgi:hypothetical protein
MQQAEVKVHSDTLEEDVSDTIVLYFLFKAERS